MLGRGTKKMVSGNDMGSPGVKTPGSEQPVATFPGRKLSEQLEDWLDTVPDTPDNGSLASEPLPITSVRAVIAP